jgi:hypothetical protein
MAGNCTSNRFAQLCAGISGTIALMTGIGWLFGKWQFATFGPDYVPMAPLTAWLFALMSFALFLLVRRPERTATRWAVGVAVVAALWVCATVLMALRRDGGIAVERLLAHTSETVRGIVIGRMSPLTAACFALAMTLTVDHMPFGPIAEIVEVPGVVAVEAGDVHRDAAARTRLGYALRVHLDAAHPDGALPRDGNQFGALANEAGYQCPGDDRAEALHGEDAVDGKPRGAGTIVLAGAPVLSFSLVPELLSIEVMTAGEARRFLVEYRERKKDYLKF